MLGRREVRWTDIAMPDFLRSPHLRKIIVYCNKIHLCQTQLNWNIIIWILLFQICLKASNVFKGYVHDPKKTAETIDEDDWIHIGDIGLFIGGLFLLKLSKQHWQKEHIISVSESNSHKLKGSFFCFLSNGVFSLSFYFTKLKIIYSRCRISTYASKKLTLTYIACLCLFLLFLTSVHPA